jgi:type IV pilus assembly protein PilV
MSKSIDQCHHLKARDGGFSLLETLLAIAILSFGLLATAALLAGIIGGNKSSKDLTTATVLAQDKIESLREAGYSGLPSVSSSTVEDYGDITYSDDGDTIVYSNFKRITSVAMDTPSVGMKTVTVQVYNRSGVNPTTFSAIMAE